MIRDYVVYVDMDGVLADFDSATRTKLGFSFADGKVSKSQKWKKINDYDKNTAPWFYTLPLMADARELWDFLTANFANVEILTASGSTPSGAAGQKRAWIGDHFGHEIKVNVVTSAVEKAAFANENSILIDDRSKAIDPFIAAGGIGILHTNAKTSIKALNVMMEDWKK